MSGHQKWGETGDNDTKIGKMQRRTVSSSQPTAGAISTESIWEILVQHVPRRSEIVEQRLLNPRTDAGNQIHFQGFEQLPIIGRLSRHG